MSSPSILAAAGLAETGSPTSIVVFALVSLALLGAVATILLRTRRQQRRDRDRPGDNHPGTGPGPGRD